MNDLLSEIEMLSAYINDCKVEDVNSNTKDVERATQCLNRVRDLAQQVEARNGLVLEHVKQLTNLIGRTI